MSIKRTTKKLLYGPKGMKHGMTAGPEGTTYPEDYLPAPEAPASPEPINEPETGAANDIRIAEAAKQAGLHTLPHAVAPPTEVPPADYVG